MAKQVKTTRIIKPVVKCFEIRNKSTGELAVVEAVTIWDAFTQIGWRPQDCQYVPGKKKGVIKALQLHLAMFVDYVPPSQTGEIQEASK